MKNERRNKRLYKTISCVVVFLVCVFAFVSLAISKASNNKVKAGVIIESSYTRGPSQTQLTISENNNNNLAYSYGVPYIQVQNIGSNGQQLCQIYNDDFSVLIGTLYIYQVRFDFNDVSMRFQKALAGTSNGTFVQTGLTIMPYSQENIDAYLIIDLTNIFAGIRSIGNNDSTLNNNNYTMSCSSFTFAAGGYFFQKSNTISACSNLQDLKNNQLSIYYLQDLSNLSSTMTNEATINYGFIDENDNTLYSVYTKYIQIAYDSAENTLTFDIPQTNTNYIFSNTYDYDGETFSAWSIDYNIYVIWVWHNDNTIKWGIGLCSHSPLYTNNMITSITEIYSLTASNSTTMTCRITDNENLNFITINNIDLTGDFPLSQVNQALRSGGIIPAYAYYQYVSGRNTGFSLGETSATRYWQDYYGSGGEGYDAIFNAGKEAGIAENIGTKDWFITAFGAVDAFLNIRIFPNITFGILLGIPFIISVVWFIICMFRGGGGGD